MIEPTVNECDYYGRNGSWRPFALILILAYVNSQIKVHEGGFVCTAVMTHAVKIVMLIICQSVRIVLKVIGSRHI